MKVTNSLGVLVLALAVVGVSSSCQPQVSEPVPQVDVAALKEALIAAWDLAEVDRYDAICAPGYVAHEVGSQMDFEGAETVKEWINAVHTAYPDFHWMIDDIFIAGDKAIIRWSWSGTNTGPLPPNPLYGELPPTGKAVSNSGIAVARLVDGKMAEGWSYYDLLSPLQQLGFTITPPTEATE